MLRQWNSSCKIKKFEIIFNLVLVLYMQRHFEYLKSSLASLLRLC